MSQGIAKASTFSVYFRHFKASIKHSANFEILSDANFINLLSDDLYEKYLAKFFSQKDKPINEVVNTMYNEYLSAKHGIILFKDEDNTDRIIYANLLFMMIKIIKYSCTIIQEYGKYETVFSTYSIIKVIRNDFLLNVKEWKYITNEQLKMRIIYSFMVKSISFICPITNYRPSSLISYLDNCNNMPLVVLDDKSFELSVCNMFKKYVLKEGEKKSFKNDIRKANCVYYGALNDFFIHEQQMPIYTSQFEDVFNAIDTLNTEKISKYRNYEIVFTIESVTSKLYSSIVCFKLYIFERVTNLGYVLQAYIRSIFTDNITSKVYFTKMINQNTIIDYLNAINDVFNSRLPMNHVNEVIGKNSIVNEIKKEYRLSSSILDEFAKNYYSPQVPEFIIYP